MTTPTIIDLIRHGEPVGGRRYRGQIDDPLSEVGWSQMWSAVSPPPPWEQIICSPLARCREFALQLGERLVIPVHQESRFREVGFGEWEGKTANELKQQDPQIIARFYRDPVNNRPTGAEPLAHFSERVAEAFLEALEAHAGKHFLIVAHAGVIRAVIAHVLDAPLEAMYRMSVDTAYMIRIQAGNGRPPTLMFHNGA